MDFWVILYSLLCVVIGGGAVAFLYKRGQTMGAMITLVLLLLIFLFYGLRWFPGGNLNGTQPGNVKWPPIVNMCPDFMVAWTDTSATGGNKVYCYDANNVYNLQRATAAAPMVAGLTIAGASGQSAFLLKDPTKNSGTAPASLAADTGLFWPLLTTLSKTSNNVLTPATKYLRWEGVWDGTNLTTENASLPK